MDSPSELSPMRDSLMVKIAFATFDRLPRLIELTRAQEEACIDRLEDMGARD